MCVHSHLQNVHNSLFHITFQLYDKLHPLKIVGSVAVSEVTRDLILFAL
jgi:hypothetical protein